jgi:hypothetical protein
MEIIAMERNTANVPASLDLVHHANLGINGLIGTMDHNRNYEPYFVTFFNANPPYMSHWSSMYSGVLPKYLEALALLRCMTGSTNLHNHEDAMLRAVLENIEQDGLIYDRSGPARPWNVGLTYGISGWDEDYTNLAGDGRLICGMDFYRQLTGDEAWAKRMERTAARMMDLAIVKGEMAYYPNVGCGNDFSYPKDSGWVHTKEPEGPAEGAEASTTFYLALPIRGLMKWYNLSGDGRALDISGKLARFVMQNKYYGGIGEQEPEFAAARAHYWGHLHGNLAAFRGLMEYGIGAEDFRVMEFCRDAFEWTRHNLCPQIGQEAVTEGCVVADLIALGIQLSDAGAGDFWDDVDYVIRNALPEAQVTDKAWLEEYSAGSPQRQEGALWGATCDFRFSTGALKEPIPSLELTKGVIDRSIGAIYGVLEEGRYAQPWTMQCCTANGNQAFYYAWEAVVRHINGDSTVNLFFNRFSEWLDVISYLPYEGKVEILNKTSRSVSVRIPGWVRRKELVCSINDQTVTPACHGRQISFTGLSGGETIMLTFPLTLEKLKLTVPHMNSRIWRGNKTMEAWFKGSTCLGLNDEECKVNNKCRDWKPLYNRTAYFADKAPLVDVEYYVPPKTIKWY